MSAWEQGHPTRDEELYENFSNAPAPMHSDRLRYGQASPESDESLIPGGTDTTAFRPMPVRRK